MGKLPAPNYTQTPNTLFDLMPEMGEAELRVSLAVCRKTFGWHKDRDRLSLSQLMELTGMSKQGVLNGIEAGISRGWLNKEAEGDSFSYALLVNEVDNPSQRSGQVLVNEVDREDVNEVDTQKKEYKEIKKTTTKESVAVFAAVSAVKKEKEPEPARKDEKVALTFQLYQQQIGVINPRLAELVREDIEDIPLEWIPLAFDRAAAANANKWAYVKGTLQNWKAQGGPQERKNESANAPPVDPSLYRHEDWVKLQASPGETVEQTFDRLKKQQRIPSNAILRRSNHNGRISQNQ